MDPNAFLASLLIGSIGLVLLLYGKRQARVPQMVVGLTLVVFTYFVSSVPLMFAIAAALIALLWAALRLGW